MIETLLGHVDTLLLLACAGGALAGGALMLVLRQPMRVAMALIATMLFLAGIYGLLGMHFIAAFQVLIYVGAVMVFMVYAIMLLDVRDRSFTRRFSWLVVPGTIAAVAFLAILAHGLWHTLPGPTPPAAGAPSAGLSFGIQRFSVEFLNEYWLHFELVSVLLVAAVVAALAVLEVGRRQRG
jgi:NADH-quinone oxidoreductase subunit J